jgi:hypothetical protein
MADNAAAIALYQRMGMRVLHDIHVLRMAKADAERFAATRSGKLRVELVEPARDAALEHRFDLGSGQLARWRTARPQAVMWQVGGVALTHYMAAFLDDCGLLFPFRAPDADHAATLVAAACEHGMCARVELCAVDEPAVAALRGAGAEVYERQLEMGGPLRAIELGLVLATK